MAGGSYLAILRIAGFLASVWSVGKVAKFIGVSSIVFEIAVGLILSPTMGGLLPKPYSTCVHQENPNNDCDIKKARMAVNDYYHPLSEMMHHMQELGMGGCVKEEKAYKAAKAAIATTKYDLAETYAQCIKKDCNKEVAHLCQSEPNVFTLIGHAGVSMMIFESGMHFDFEKAKVVGGKACIVAVLGTLLPLFSGYGLVLWLYPGRTFWCAISTGVALAPTSVGIALRLLLEAKQLQKDFGQAIITAAFVDDILSLVAFNILFSASTGEFTFMGSIFPALVGMVFLVCGAGLGIRFWPFVVENMLSRVPAKKGAASLSRQDEALLLLMFGLLLAYATFTFYLGTHLWGCFVAGMSFAMIHHAHHIWVRQVKRMTVWMLRIFFSCTVGFAIPWQNLLSVEAFWKGSIMGIVACVFTKVICAFFMGDARFVIGWAMVGRAEFAYLIAELAKSGGIMDEDVFAMVIWSLLYATIFAPFCFRKVLSKYAIKLEAKEKEEAAKAKASGELDKIGGVHQGDGRCGKGHTTMDGHKWHTGELQAFRFQIVYPTSAPACNVEDLEEIWQLLHKFGLSITQMVQQCDKDTHFSTFQVQSEDGKEMDETALNFVQQEIFQEMRGLGAHIIFLPPMHSLTSKCKLAKLTVIADLASGTSDIQGTVTSISSIIDAIIVKSFYIMRAGLEVHGKTAVIHFLVSHVKSLEVVEEVEPASPILRAQKSRQASAGFSKADIGHTHLHMGTAQLPDIQPQELEALKKRIESFALPEVTRISTVVQPMTYDQGALGEVSHDANTLMKAQSAEPTCEIRFTCDILHKDLFAHVLRSLSKPGISLVSARVDERASCQIMIVCSHANFTAALEGEIMDGLAKVCGDLGMTGHIDLANLNAPLEKQYRDYKPTDEYLAKMAKKTSK
eukprot:TRINITY_DN1632_c0_g2_i1.p1 TRINITY_DN1632_c0_g2~~TRINITY_DN1632_c0_g2_i1.p1  ORF type:complete len:904 (+),score=272.23 TRINITY_DN1632_c0_g2_i1:220-2931(+)